MKPIAVLFATREGHTKKVAAYVAARLRERGQEVELHDITDLLDDAVLERCSGAVLAASIHAGQHERAAVNFVKRHRDRLEQIPSAFLSVSLTEVGAEMESASEEKRRASSTIVAQMIDRFAEKTGWRADLVKPVAGALLYTKYGMLIRFVMKRIAMKQGGDTDTSRDYEYTDWSGLDEFADAFVAILGETLVEPTGFVMDRRVAMGVKEGSERG